MQKDEPSTRVTAAAPTRAGSFSGFHFSGSGAPTVTTLGRPWARPSHVRFDDAISAIGRFAHGGCHEICRSGRPARPPVPDSPHDRRPRRHHRRRPLRSRHENHTKGMPDPMELTSTTAVNKPPQEVYDFWHRLENLATFMAHLDDLRVTGPRPSHSAADA